MKYNKYLNHLCEELIRIWENVQNILLSKKLGMKWYMHYDNNIKNLYKISGRRYTQIVSALCQVFISSFFYYWHVIFIVEIFKNDLENSEDFYD